MKRVLFLALLVSVVAFPLRVGAITPAQPEFRKLAVERGAGGSGRAVKQKDWCLKHRQIP